MSPILIYLAIGAALVYGRASGDPDFREGPWWLTAVVAVGAALFWPFFVAAWTWAGVWRARKWAATNRKPATR